MERKVSSCFVRVYHGEKGTVESGRKFGEGWETFGDEWETGGSGMQMGRGRQGWKLKVACCIPSVAQIDEDTKFSSHFLLKLGHQLEAFILGFCKLLSKHPNTCSTVSLPQEGKAYFYCSCRNMVDIVSYLHH